MPTNPVVKKCQKRGRCLKGGFKSVGSNASREGDKAMLDQFQNQFPPATFPCWLLPNGECWLITGGSAWLLP